MLKASSGFKINPRENPCFCVDDSSKLHDLSSIGIGVIDRIRSESPLEINLLEIGKQIVNLFHLCVQPPNHDTRFYKRCRKLKNHRYPRDYHRKDLREKISILRCCGPPSGFP